MFWQLLADEVGLVKAHCLMLSLGVLLSIGLPASLPSNQVAAI